jgi:coproporphyrinogen III oxidase-like Fe-S oxidoreductase
VTASSTPVGLPDLQLGPGGPFGIYVHVPFCFTRCGYCDFNTYTPAELGGVNPDAWLQVLASELELAAARLGGPTVQTVFIGGGTPSLLGGERLARVLKSVRDNFELAADAEVTTEANPESAWPDFFAAARAAGCTRVSLGMQSVAPHVLGVLDRIHTPNRSAAAAREALAEGFEHVSLDLIYGTPGESDDDLLWSVETAIDTGVDHISAYALVVEDGTALVRGVELESARRAVPTQSGLLGRRTVVGRRPGRTQLRRPDAMVECQAPERICPASGRGDAAGRRLRAAGRREPSHRGRAAEDPAASGPASRPARPSRA